MANTVPVDMYRTTVMLEAIRLTPIKQTFLRDNFFPVVKEFQTEDCLIDIKRRQRAMAPIVSRRKRGQVVERYPYRTFRVEPPFITPVRTLTIEDLEKRLPGEAFFDPMSLEQRQMETLAEDTEELFDMCDRREEWMCAQVLMTGAITAISDDPLDAYEFHVDYGFTQNITLTGAALWSNITTSNPFLDLQTGIQLVSQNSTVVPDIALMSPATWRYFVASQNVQRTMFARSISIGEINPAKAPYPGARLVSRLTDPPIDIWVYIEWFQDPQNSYANTQLIADGKVLFLQKEGNTNRMYCSAVKQMDPVTENFTTYASRRVPRIWNNIEDQTKKYSLTTKILPAPVDVANWAIMTVL